MDVALDEHDAVAIAQNLIPRRRANISQRRAVLAQNGRVAVRLLHAINDIFLVSIACRRFFLTEEDFFVDTT